MYIQGRTTVESGEQSRESDRERVREREGMKLRINGEREKEERVEEESQGWQNRAVWSISSCDWPRAGDGLKRRSVGGFWTMDFTPEREEREEREGR